MVSNAENASIWWRHYDFSYIVTYVESFSLIHDTLNMTDEISRNINVIKVFVMCDITMI